jgi:Flp pilus assembly protein TadG
MCAARNTAALKAGRRTSRRKGAESLEFTLVFLPMIMMILVLLDISWAIFAKSTLTAAVRTGLRYGITITGTQATAASSDLVAMVKTRVQQRALGLLSGSTGLAKIKVHFYAPPASGSNAAPVLVDAQADANKPLNIMQVSVEGFTLSPLVPRLFGLYQPIDNAASSIVATSYDMIEASRDLPPKGIAP